MTVIFNSKSMEFGHRNLSTRVYAWYVCVYKICSLVCLRRNSFRFVFMMIRQFTFL